MKARICVGTGGVGKTTISTALALAAAKRGSRALVLTIDPARRLKSLLGLEEKKGEQKVRLGDADFWAAMLDVEHALETAVRQHGDRNQAEQVLNHPIYRMLISSLAGMQELMAVEYIEQARRKGFETIVIDTAPSRHAFEFLDKPEFFADLVSMPMVRWVGGTYRFWSKTPLAAVGRRAMDMYGRLEDLVGARVLSQVLDFYSLFQSIAEGYARRARETTALLRDADSSRFFVVTTPEKAERDRGFFQKELSKRSFRTDGILMNRVWPAEGRQGNWDPEIRQWFRVIRDDQQQIIQSVRTECEAQGMSAVTLLERPQTQGSAELIERLADDLNRSLAL